MPGIIEVTMITIMAMTRAAEATSDISNKTCAQTFGVTQLHLAKRLQREAVLT